MIIYLAGPYRAKTTEGEEKNVALAKGVAKLLWLRGYAVHCPHLNTHEFDKPSTEVVPAPIPGMGEIDYSLPGLSVDAIMRGDKMILERSDALVLLPGWEMSEGSQIEKHHAEKVGVPIYVWPDLPPLYSTEAPEKPEPVLVEAQRLITGVRDGNYGHPLDDFFGAAAMMTGAFWRKLRPEAAFYPWDIPLVHQCTKISRESHQHKRDNPIDGGGYWGTLQEVYDEIERRGLTPEHFKKGGRPR